MARWYGRTTQLAQMPRPSLPPGWEDDPAKSIYVQENPGDFNAWYLQQPGYTQRDLNDKFYGFLSTWLGRQVTGFGGHKITNPEARYEDYLLSQNPWLAYQQENRATIQAPSFFGPRLQKR